MYVRRTKNTDTEFDTVPLESWSSLISEPKWDNNVKVNLVDVGFVDLAEVEFCQHHDSWLLVRKCYVFEFIYQWLFAGLDYILQVIWIINLL
jgi:hypothetical protein